MKKHLLLLTVLLTLCVCITTYSTINGEAISYLNTFSADTIKTANNGDSTAVNAMEGIALEPWRQWRTVENFTFGKDRGDMPMIADLNSLHPYFRDRIYQLIDNCKAKGIELVVVESYRTHAKQSEYFHMGRKYTRSAGGKSKHQYGLAVDVVPVKDSVAIWDNIALWKKIGVEGEKLGLRWGGRWKSPYDPAHFEWTGGLTTIHLSSGIQPAIPSSHLKNYPCIEHDVEELKRHWELWEDEQSMVSGKNLKAISSTNMGRP